MDFKNLNLSNIAVIARPIPPVVTSGLVYYVDASNAASYTGFGTNWTDLSGQGYTTTLGSGIKYSADLGGSLVFDGTSNAWAGVTGSQQFNYDYSAGVTVLVIAKFDSSTKNSTAWQRLIDFGNGTPANNIILCRNANSDSVLMDIEGINDNSGPYLNPGEMSLDWDQWKMYGMLADGTYWKEYKNGQFYSYEGNQVVPVSLNRAYNYIGRSNWNADSYYKGSISAVLIYNRALTEPEILQNYEHFKLRVGL